MGDDVSYLGALRAKLAWTNPMPSGGFPVAQTPAAAGGLRGLWGRMGAGGRAGAIGMIAMSVLPSILNMVTGNQQAMAEGRAAMQQAMPLPTAPTMMQPNMPMQMMQDPMTFNSFRMPNVSIG